MDEPQQPSDAAAAHGPSIIGYRDFTPLGQGGFAVVYRAYQEKFDRIVAVKILTISLDDRARERFIRECRATGKLSGHPNVVTVLDAGVTNDGRPYMATELMERGSIADWIDRNGPMALADALQVGVKMCGALSVVHHAGILHRDVKPQNILVSGYGEPALSDFGISAVGMGTAGARATMTFTPEFTPPEILEGRPPEPAMDVYSLGATIYALLNGHPPFVSNEDEGLLPFIRRLMHDPIPPLPEAVAPPEVVEVLATAMAKDAAERFPTAEAFGTRLQELQAALGQPVTPMFTKAGGPEADPTAGIEALLRTTGTGTAGMASPTAATVAHAPRKSNGPWIAAAAVVLVVGLLAAVLLVNRGGDTGAALSAGGTSVPGPGGALGGAPVANPAAPTAGGTLRVALREDIGTLSPETTSATPSAFAVFSALTDPLLRITDSGIEPVLAESVTPNDTFTEWTITVRDGVRFHSGKPLDGKAVAASLNTFRKNLVVAPLASAISSIEATGERTVRVRTRTPWSAFPGTLAQGLGFIFEVPDGSGGGPNPSGRLTPRELVGTGPFAVAPTTDGKSLTLVRNDDYWGTKPFLDRIELRVLPSEEERAAALENGDVDVVFASEGPTIARLNQRFPMAVQSNATATYIVLDTSRPPFDDERVRDLLAESIDRKALVAAAGAQATELTFATALGPLAGPATPLPRTEPARLKLKLAELRRDGVPMKFQLDTVINTTSAKLGPILKKTWEEIALRGDGGFEVSVQAMTQEAITKEQLLGKNPDTGADAGAAVLSSASLPPDPDIFYPFVHSGSPINISKLADDTIDRLLVEGRSTDDPAARTTAYTNLANRLNDTNAFIFLIGEPYALIAGPKVTGLTPDLARDLLRGGTHPWVTRLGIQP